jgi:uncharacterized Fe-S cluster-containing radical SAM superfamily enzyme
MDYLVEEFEKIVEFKGREHIEAHIDTVGDPITYPKIVELVARLKQISGVDVVSMQTHGSILDTKLLSRLSEAGLTRLNFSIDALRPELAKRLTDAEWYETEKMVELMHFIVSSTKIDLLVAPVWVPSVNDEEIPKIIQLAVNLGAGKRFPPLGIQKYERHKHGRKVKGVGEISWKSFYSQLKIWEQKFRVKLIISPRTSASTKGAYSQYPTRNLRKLGLGLLARLA